MMARNLAEDPVLVEQRHRDQLGEQSRLAALDRLPQRATRAARRRPELDRPHQPQPAHLAHDLVAIGERRGQLQQQLPHALCALDQSLLL